ncbi:amidohydrolase family protein [Cryptosporangium aurantiacum]|uniref:Predicted metal-dependent hydrolase, TIM-barrel fold n=1 Tax=Cryptosporangium aurantiacum TaxID=134849 RepID=A0A1M7TYJ8_9ACTN|nr:amidohydrolase family protein [Cryptosporangium aurantiacum]SHN75755.1 Predicted metal-dependent hydrolase, TIM-barrel fold [Cryptosporangium aurantiacum]
MSEDTSKPDLSWLISVDDHILEPPNVWQDRVPAKDKDRAPRMVPGEHGEIWVYEDKRVPTSGLSAAAGRKKEEFSPKPLSYGDMRAGCYDSVARLDDMNQAGILASLCFPSFPRFCGQIFAEAQDKELALICVKAYNDWIIDEWCGSAPGRYIPMTLIPLWDPVAAAAEIERCAEKGSRAIAFSENPAPLGLPTIHDPSGYWDPVMSTAHDADLVVCMHAGSSSTMPKISPNAPVLANMAWGPVRASGAMLEWLFSPYLQNLPNLRIALSEGGVGWIPYFLERAEQVLDKQRHWASKAAGVDLYGAMDQGGKQVDLHSLDLRKTFRDHVYGCFIDDIHAMNSVTEIGEDNVMIETDYPHTDSTWPDSIELAHKRLAHLPESTQYKLLRGNAERVFRFTPAQPPVLA